MFVIRSVDLSWRRVSGVETRRQCSAALCDLVARPRKIVFVYGEDGKVSVERAKLEGMADFLVVPHAQPFIMKSDLVIDQVLYFLEYGRFEVDESGAD